MGKGTEGPGSASKRQVPLSAKSTSENLGRFCEAKPCEEKSCEDEF
jgi:hypothetical protein